MKLILTLILMLSLCMNSYAQSAHFSVSNSAPFCSNTTIYFNDLSSPSTSMDPIISWLWYFGDGDSSTVQNPTHTYQALGTYIVSLTIFDGTFSASHTVPIDVLAVGTNGDFVYTFNDPTTVVFDNTSGNNIMSSAWYFGDQATETNIDENITHTYNAPGQYDVCLTVTNTQGCQDSTCQMINISLANISETLSPNNSQLFYPNPSSGLLLIDAALESPKEVIIYSYSGHIIKTISGQNITTIDISDLPSGMYYITYIGSENKMTQKVTKI